MRAVFPGILVVAAGLTACGGDSTPVTPATAPAPPASTVPPPATVPPPVTPALPRFRFVDTAAQAGLTVPSLCGRPEMPHLLDSGGSGVALFDFDGDGDLDLYQVVGWRIEGERVAEKGRNRLFRNAGDGTFTDVTDSAGVGDDGWGTGVCTGDFDGDGRPDLFVTNFGPDVLYRNGGDGTFERVADPPGMDGWSAGAVAFDADGDGDDDLYVTGYVEGTLADILGAKRTLDWKGDKVAVGPFGLPGKGNRFFRNDGGLRFTDATEAAGLVDVGRFFSLGAMALDFDGDGDLDLYVANDSNPNYLYRNDGTGRFEEIGLWSGAAYSATAAAQAGMGLAAGDFDGDGDPDFVVTNFADDHCTLYRNDGRGLFSDVSGPAGIAQPTYAPLSWGSAFADLDLDGDLDLVILNGHIYPQADTAPLSRQTFRQRNLLLENGGDGTFRDASADAGPGFALEESSRGIAVGDMDGDGDLDMVLSHLNAPPTLLRNDSPRAGAWLLVDAPGALRVEVEAGGRILATDRVRGGSYLSEHAPMFHFGLGAAKRADRVRVRVRWPGGVEKVLEDVPVDRVVSVPR